MKLESIKMKYGRTELNKAGIEDKHIIFLCATGSHRSRQKRGTSYFREGSCLIGSM